MSDVVKLESDDGPMMSAPTSNLNAIQKLPPSLIRNCTAELFGTIFLCLVIIVARGTNVDLDGSPAGELVGVAIAHAFVLASLAGSFGDVSGGHFNPAVTLALVLSGQTTWKTGIFYVIAQMIGGIGAGGIAVLIIPPSAQARYAGAGVAAPLACGVFPQDSAQAFAACWQQALAAEFVGTLFLILTILMTAVAGHSDGAHLSIGLSLGVGVLAFGPISNACFNPARAIGAAVVAFGLNWDTMWVWVVGPLAASVVAALLFRMAFQTTDDKSLKHA